MMEIDLSFTFELEAHCLRCKRRVELDEVFDSKAKIARQMSTDEATVLELEVAERPCPQCAGVRYVVAMVM